MYHQYFDLSNLIFHFCATFQKKFSPIGKISFYFTSFPNAILPITEIALVVSVFRCLSHDPPCPRSQNIYNFLLKKGLSLESNYEKISEFTIYSHVFRPFLPHFRSFSSPSRLASRFPSKPNLPVLTSKRTPRPPKIL